MRTLAAILLVPLLGATAFAEEALELLDGTTIACVIVKTGATSVSIRPVSGGIVLEVPWTYLSPLARYEIRRRESAPEAAARLARAAWCLKHAAFDARLLAGAEAELRGALEAGAERDRVDALTLPADLCLGPDGTLVSPEKAGYVKDAGTGTWIRKTDLAARRALERRRKKETLLVRKPGAYARIPLSVLRGALAEWGGKRIRIWTHFRERRPAFLPFATKAGLSVGPTKYLGLLLTDEDCASAYVPRAKRNVLAKTDLLDPGERLLVFARVHLTAEGFVLILDDLISG